jgi:hypothetical protein
VTVGSSIVSQLAARASQRRQCWGCLPDRKARASTEHCGSHKRTQKFSSVHVRNNITGAGFLTFRQSLRGRNGDEILAS